MQHFSFIDLFIDLFESALRVSGDKLARLQEHFRLYIQLRYNAPMLLSTGDKVGSNIGALYCTKSCIYSQKKCSWRWASLSPETCTADSNRSIKRSINENCCISLVAYVVVPMTHGPSIFKTFCYPCLFSRNSAFRNIEVRNWRLARPKGSDFLRKRNK